MTTPPVLPSELTIYTASELRPQFLDWLQRVREAPLAGDGGEDIIELDAAAVTEVDGAGLQFLLSVANSLGQVHRVLRLSGPSRVLIDACAALGVSHLIHLDEVADLTDGAVA